MSAERSRFGGFDYDPSQPRQDDAIAGRPDRAATYAETVSDGTEEAPHVRFASSLLAWTTFSPLPRDMEVYLEGTKRARGADATTWAILCGIRQFILEMDLRDPCVRRPGEAEARYRTAALLGLDGEQ